MILDHVVEGQVEDLMPDDGLYPGGLFAAAGVGVDIEDAEADVRAEYDSAPEPVVEYDLH